MEVQGRTPLTGQVMPFSGLRALSIFAIIFAIFASPVLSIQWVSGQSIGNNNTSRADGQGSNQSVPASLV